MIRRGRLESILGIDQRMKRVLAAKKATGKLTEDEGIDKAYTDPITLGPRASRQEAQKLVAAYIAEQQQNPTDTDDQAIDQADDDKGDSDYDPDND